VFSSPDLVFNLSRQAATGPIVNDPDTVHDERVLLTRMADGTIRYAGALHVLFVGTVNADRMRSSEGDDTLRGNEVNDRLEGGAGNDQMIGGSGQDVLTDTFGDDVLKGGDGNDAMSSGAGFDLNQGGLGDDFVVGGSDPTETFGGPGDDMIFGGDSSDTIFGDDGDDWLEGGAQADLVQGDNGAPFQDDPNTPGHDVLNGLGGQDDYDAEGGDDILVAGAGIERNEGMLGFDWVTHKNDPQAADDDLDLSVFLPPSVDALRDRFDLVEAMSGGNQNDILRGDDAIDTDLVDNELTAEGIARIAGLDALVGTTGFTGGNIIIGGEGSDLIEGRGGNDVIHGDVWLNVQLRAPNVATADTTDVVLVDSMSALQADVFAGRLDPGAIEIVRSIVNSAPGSFTDTAVFSGARAEYDVTVNADGSTTVAHARGTAQDGTDTLRGIEVMQFADVAGATAPTAPLNVAATAGNGQATVTFTGPAGDGGSPITEFEIDVLSGTTLVRTVPDIAPTARSVVVPNLTNGTAYTFVVRAINAIGDTNSAPSAAVTPRAPAVVPSAPTIGAATGGNASATVRWTGPAIDGGSPITGYQVEVRTGTTVVRTVTGIAATATQTVVPTLTNGTAYNFRVQAVNAVGAGAPSAASNTVTPAVPATVPAAPTIGTATGGNASATVRWTAPANAGGSPITGYQVDVRVNGVVQGAARVAPATATSLAVTGLTNGTAYTFQVRAINAVGQGALSAVSNTVTPAAVVPGAPTIGTATAGNASATVRWTAPASNGGSAITSYSVQVRNAAGTVLRTVTGIPAAAVSTNVTALTNGTAYNFRVLANNAAGAGPLSAASNAVTPAGVSVPGAPTGLVATSGSAGGPLTASFTWVAPASNGGSAITAYRATAHRIGANGAVVGTQTSGLLAPTARVMTFFVNVTGNYRFTIQAINAAGTGPHSAMSNQVIGR
jgi:Ca2+-binding RTX toxin-like protein